MSAPDAGNHWSDLMRTVRRWTAGRKALLVDAVANGQVSLDEALVTHGITRAEFEDWRTKLARGGEQALKATCRSEAV